MFEFNRIVEWKVWVLALSGPLHGRLAWKLPTVIAEIHFASGRRTVSTVKRFKMLQATWRPAGGLIRVVIVKEDDESWRGFLRADVDASAESIVQVVHDR